MQGSHVATGVISATLTPIPSGFGRVRAMENERGERLKEAGPSTPVQIIGLSEVPDAGQVLHAVENERAARDVAEHREAALELLQNTG